MIKVWFCLDILLLLIGLFLIVANIMFGVGIGLYGGIVILGYSSYMLYKNRGAFKKVGK